MDPILCHYFPQLSVLQTAQYAALEGLYRSWNEKINVISRKDIDALYVHHVLHSLAIAQVVSFEPHTTVLDVGTGGGFPGIPLAILFPKVQFVLADSIGKKLKIVEDVAAQIGLKNVQIFYGRAETLKKFSYEYVVSRAVATLPQMLQWIDDKMKSAPVQGGNYGLYYLKGGDLTAELADLCQRKIRITEISQFFNDSYFEGKKVVYIAPNSSHASRQ